jgi:hypothetical protein
MTTVSALLEFGSGTGFVNFGPIWLDAPDRKKSPIGMLEDRKRISSEPRHIPLPLPLPLSTSGEREDGMDALMH